jgi:hypothetical protein
MSNQLPQFLPGGMTPQRISQLAYEFAAEVAVSFAANFTVETIENKGQMSVITFAWEELRLVVYIDRTVDTTDELVLDAVRKQFKAASRWLPMISRRYSSKPKDRRPCLACREIRLGRRIGSRQPVLDVYTPVLHQ